MDIVSFLEKEECSFELFPHEPTYSAQRLAQALHVKGIEVAKAVLLRADDGSKFVIAVLPANKKIDLQAASRLIGGVRLHLATEIEIAARCPDCEFGVLPPFGSRFGIRTIVDSSLAEDEDIFFDAMTHSEAIRMAFTDYQKLEKTLVGPFALSE